MAELKSSRVTEHGSREEDQWYYRSGRAAEQRYCGAAAGREMGHFGGHQVGQRGGHIAMHLVRLHGTTRKSGLLGTTDD